MIKSLKLRNFTAFSNISAEFSPKINIIIGENGTGKTHLIKAAYAMCKYGGMQRHNYGVGDLESALSSSLIGLFKPMDNKLGKLCHNNTRKQSQLEASFTPEAKISLSFHSVSKTAAVKVSGYNETNMDEALFVPTKEVLSLVKGMTDHAHDQNTIDLMFDSSYTDLVAALVRPYAANFEEKINKDPRVGTIIPELVSLIGGKYHWYHGDFVFQSGGFIERKPLNLSRAKSAQAYQDSTVTQFKPFKDRSLSCNMTAEGYRKIGILYQLLVNGSLNPGVSGPLFWDEPESNLNPKIMKAYVQILLELARNGQQIILATHDYVLLKWFDLLKDKGKGDHIRFHSLVRNIESGEIVIESMDDYKLINKSSISDAFAELYDEDIRRALG